VVDADIGVGIAAVDVGIEAPAEFDEDVDVTLVEEVVAAGVVDVVDGGMAGHVVEERDPADVVGDAGVEMEYVWENFVAEVEERVSVAVAGTGADEQAAVADVPMALAEEVQMVAVDLKIDKNLDVLVATCEKCVEDEEGFALVERKPTGTVHNPDALSLDVGGAGPAHEAVVRVVWHVRMAHWANSAQDDIGPSTGDETEVHMSHTVAGHTRWRERHETQSWRLFAFFSVGWVNVNATHHHSVRALK
jgi:hypothetical protein